MEKQQAFGSNKNILLLSMIDAHAVGEILLNDYEILREHGHNVECIVGVKTHNNSVTKGYFDKRKFLSLLFLKIYRCLFERKVFTIKTVSKYHFYGFNYSMIKAKWILNNVKHRPNVIILYWISNLISIEEILKLKTTTNAKIIWIMMDNAAMTGGCHYPCECIGYQTDCSDCPAICSPSQKHLASDILKLKRDLFANDIQIIATQSDVLRLEKSEVFKHSKLTPMVAMVDSLIFWRRDKTQMRMKYNILNDQKVFLWASTYLNEERKGAAYLLGALKIFKQQVESEGKSIKDILLLVAGNNVPDEILKLGFTIKQLGFLPLPELAEVFSASDAFICSSVEDSGPLMINQAIACGTPVIAFNNGSALDLVYSNITGYRAELCNTIDLASGIYYMYSLNKVEISQMNVNCVELAQNKMSKRVYSNLLENAVSG